MLFQTWNLEILVVKTLCGVGFPRQLLFSAHQSSGSAAALDSSPVRSTFLSLVIKNSNQKQFKEERIYLTSTSRFWSIAEGSQGRNSSRNLKHKS